MAASSSKQQICSNCYKGADSAIASAVTDRESVGDWKGAWGWQPAPLSTESADSAVTDHGGGPHPLSTTSADPATDSSVARDSSRTHRVSLRNREGALDVHGGQLGDEVYMSTYFKT